MHGLEVFCWVPGDSFTADYLKVQYTRSSYVLVGLLFFSGTFLEAILEEFCPRNDIKSQIMVNIVTMAYS